MLKITEIFNDNSFKFQRPYIIAEAGVNHEGSMELAKRLIDEAVEGVPKPLNFRHIKLIP